MSRLPTSNPEIINLDDSPPPPEKEDPQMFMKLELELSNCLQACAQDAKITSHKPHTQTASRSQTPNTDFNQHAYSETYDLDYEGSDLSRPVTPSSTHSSLDQDQANVDSPDATILDLEDCYMCLDCDNKLLMDSDQLSDHCQIFPDHFNINPLCVYNSFNLQLTNVAKSKAYGKAVEALTDLHLLQKSRKSVKRTLKDVSENQEQKPPQKMTVARTTTSEFEYNG
jgi:hypothetical protein